MKNIIQSADRKYRRVAQICIMKRLNDRMMTSTKRNLTRIKTTSSGNRKFKRGKSTFTNGEWFLIAGE